MNYWLICLPRPDMEQCIKVGVFGLNRKQTLGRIQQDDKVACCAGKGDWKIIALGTATSEYYLDDAKIFLQDGVFPDRFKFTAKQLPTDDELDLMSVIDSLSFVKNLAHWGVYFRNGIVQMSQQDWKLLEKV